MATNAAATKAKIKAHYLIAITFGGILFVPVSEIERLKNKQAAEGTAA